MTPPRQPLERRRHRRRPLGRPEVRLRGGLAVVVLVLLVIGGRLVQLQGLPASRVDAVTGVPVAYAELAERQRTTSTELRAARGDITDRNGQALAMTVAARAVYGEPRTIRKAGCPAGAAKPCTPAALAAALAPVLGLDAAVLRHKLGGDASFVYLARGLDPAVGTAVRERKLLGIGVIDEPRRVHPAGDLAAGVVGFTDSEGKGLAGLEHAYDSVLRGADGRRTVEVDKAGRVIPTGANAVEQPMAGHDLQLTIDRDLQWHAQKAISRKVAEVGAENGSAVVMDVRTGEVLALATTPGFNPDDRAGVPAAALRNPAVEDIYEPGSVAKVITAAAALESGITTPDRVQVVPDRMRVQGRTFHDSHRHEVQQLTFAGVIATSSNVGTIQVAQQLGPQRLHDAFRSWGIGEKSGLGLPGESSGRLPALADWSGSSLPTIAIGQGVSANAVQVASVYATVANGGVRVTPSVVRSVSGPDGAVRPAPAPSRRVVSERVAGQLRAMLEAVVSEEGTAPHAAIAGYRIAGKTGTAQRVVNGRYLEGNYSSSFVGFAPADAPRLVTAVVVQGTSGKREYYGGTVAGPVFRDVMSVALSSLAVPPTGTRPAPMRLFADGSR